MYGAVHIQWFLRGLLNLCAVTDIIVAWLLRTCLSTTQFRHKIRRAAVKDPGKALGTFMRPIITIDATNRPVSQIEDADHAISHIVVGTVFEFETAYSTPWGDVPAGVTAVVTEVHDETGELDLEVRERIPALFYWANILIILPFMSDDLLACLRLLKPMIC